MGSPLLPTRFYRHLPTSGEADPLDSVDVKRIDGAFRAQHSVSQRYLPKDRWSYGARPA